MDLTGSSAMFYFQKAFLATLLGITFFQLGYYFSSSKKFKVPKTFSKKWKRNNVYLVVVFYFLVGFLSFLILINSNGGLLNFLSNIEGFRAGGLIGQGFLMYPATTLLSIGVLIFTIWKFKDIARYKDKNSLKKAIFLLIISILPSLLLGFRILIILPFLSFLIVYNYLYRNLDARKLIFLVSLIIGFFVIYGIYREIPPGVEITKNKVVEILEENPEIAYSFLSRSKGIEVVASVIKKLDKTKEYDLGYKSIFETLTIAVPHSLWPSKPTPSSVRFTTYFFGDNLDFIRGSYKDDWGGISPTIIGEAYWHFGWTGVIVGLFLFGWFVKKIYLTFIFNLQNSFVILLYTLFFVRIAMSAEAVQGNINGLMLDIIFLTITSVLLRLKLKLK